MHEHCRSRFEKWSPFQDSVRRDMAAKGVSEDDADTNEPLEGVVYST